MEAILLSEEYVYESQEIDNMTLLKARFDERYTITFSSMQENSIRSTLRAILHDKIESQRQRSVAATYIAKVRKDYIPVKVVPPPKRSTRNALNIGIRTT